MLTENQIQGALHAGRVVSLSVPNPHGPLGLEQLAAALAGVDGSPTPFGSRNCFKSAGISNSITMDFAMLPAFQSCIRNSAAHYTRNPCPAAARSLKDCDATGNVAEGERWC